MSPLRPLILPYTPPPYGDPLKHRAADVIPGGSSTGSKRPEALYGSQAGRRGLPTHFLRAEGCRFISDDGRSYIDCSMALGAVAIGYADGAVNRLVQEAVTSGNVSGVPHQYEVIVAERLVEVIPCAEAVRFLRTGAEATAAAVRIARTATGKTHVIACGYFGWLDWCSDSTGVPQSVAADITWVPFDDIDALEAAVTQHSGDLAAIIIEPVIHDIASRAWLEGARAACDRVGAVLIFDEIKTAFRIRTGGVQELLGVVPDLATVGKALANGYPLSAVVGRAGVMESAIETWISSTAANESTGLAAALAVLDWHDRVDVPERLRLAGVALMDIFQQVLSEYPTGVSVSGIPQMLRLSAMREERLDTLVVAAASAGVLLKRGAYQFVSLAHDEGVLELLRRFLPVACEIAAEQSG